MFNMTESSTMLGPAWWILNVLRGCNVVALLSVAASSVVLVVKTDVINNFFFFQALAHFITCGVALMLIVSELPQFGFVRDFYRNNWPTFTTVDASNRPHSLAWLGVWMVSMGVWVLGSLDADDLIEKLSLPLWRLTLASGILAIVFGFFNLIVSVIFRNGHHNITTRMIREHGANVYNVRTTITSPEYDLDTSTLNTNPSIRKEKRAAANNNNTFTNNRFTRFMGKDKKLQISRPMPQEHDVEAAYPQDDHRESWEGADRASPIAPNVRRPPTALHPAYTGGARSSIYSVVSHINRF